MEPKTITAYKSEDFRKWLAKNHAKEARVAVILYKRHTSKPAPTHRELMNEAICYGWIDTTVKRLDEDRYIRRFAKRTKNSTWSDNTLRYAKELIKEGRMSEEGMNYYKMGKVKPTHDDGIPKNPSMPKEVKAALAKNKKAQKAFEAFPPSTKKMLYRWFLSAKRPETKEKRVKEIVKAALENNKRPIGTSKDT